MYREINNMCSKSEFFGLNLKSAVSQKCTSDNSSHLTEFHVISLACKPEITKMIQYLA